MEPVLRLRTTALSVCFLAFALLLASVTGCHRMERIPGEEGPPAAGSIGAPEHIGKQEKEPPPSLPSPEQPAIEAGASPSAGGEGREAAAGQGKVSHGPEPGSAASSAMPVTAETGKEQSAEVESPREGTPPREEAEKEKSLEGTPPAPEPSSPPSSVPPSTAGGPGAGAGTPAVVALPEEETYSRDAPPWARTREELSYKVEFLGITMGYARFTSLGKVRLSGTEAYHLRVRAWTSGVLSLIYPIDDTIDYYLDVRTLVPLRQEYTRGRKDDDVAIYDQKNGTIVYRYRKDGKIRKKVDVLPNVYDPVSAVYYFRTHELADGRKELSMYAGRKVWEVSAKAVGVEQITTDRGEFETIVVQPVLRRKGKLEDEKKMRMWMTTDDRHVPVRIYAKFKKIRTWTLVGELVPGQQGG